MYNSLHKCEVQVSQTSKNFGSSLQKLECYLVRCMCYKKNKKIRNSVKKMVQLQKLEIVNEQRSYSTC